MKKEIISFIAFVSITLTSCCQNNKFDIKILPLHPYKASPTDYDHSDTKEKSYINKFFFIRGACVATDELSKRVDSFVLASLKDDSDFIKYGGYYIDFFKESNELNENYRQGNGTDETPSKHISEDLIFSYHWSNKKFTGCDFYKNGKVIKTIYNNNGDVFKHDSSIESTEPDVILEEVPRKDSAEK